MNRYTYYNSELDAFTNYHLQQEAVEGTHHDGPSDRSDALAAGLSGAVGSAVATLAVYPIDLIVKRLQVQRQLRGHSTLRPHEKTARGIAKELGVEGEELYADFTDAARRIYNEEGGLKAFYSGCLHDTVNSMSTAFLYFLSYNYMRDRRLRSQVKGGKNTLGMVEELGVGVFAGCFAKFFTSPIANVVTRKQTAALSGEGGASKKAVPGVSVIMKDIYREKGILGFWSGYNATLFLTLNPSITLFLYETFKTLLPRRFRDQPTAGQTFIIAAVAKAMASSIMYPFSLAKARSQVQKGWNIGVIQTLRGIYREDGIWGLYEGIEGEIFKGFFQNGITMLIKEFIHRWFLSVYLLFQRARDASPDRSITGTVNAAAQEVYDKNTTDSQKAAVERAASAAQNGVDAVKGTVNSAATAVSNTAQSGYEAAKDTVSNTAAVVNNTAASTFDAAKNAASNTTTAVGNKAASGYEVAKEAVANTATAVSNTATDSYNATTAAASNTTAAVESTAAATYEAAKNTASNTADTAKGAASSGYNVASNVASTTASAATNAAEAAKEAATSGYSATASTASNLASSASATATNTKEAAVDKMIQSRQGLAQIIDVPTPAPNASIASNASGQEQIGVMEWDKSGDVAKKLQEIDTQKAIGGVEWDGTGKVAETLEQGGSQSKIGGVEWDGTGKAAEKLGKK